MRKALTIRIPEPCHENWNTMIPKDKGRHCAVCEKTVVDFTKFTDEEVVKIYMQEDNLCGRFKNTQLERELVFSRKERNNYLSLVASSLFAFLSIGTQDVKAQGEPRIVQIDSTKASLIKGLKARSILQEKVIRGTIISKNDGFPLPGTNIIVKGTLRGAQADFDGNYSIKVKIGETLVFSYSGMESTEIVVGTKSTIDISLKESLIDIVLGGIGITVGGISSNTVEIYGENYLTPKEKKNEIDKRLKSKEQFLELNKKYRLEKSIARKEKRQQVKNGNVERSSIGKLFYNLTNVFRTNK